MKKHIKIIFILLAIFPISANSISHDYSFSNSLETKNPSKVWNTWVDIDNWNKWDTEIEYSKLSSTIFLNSKGTLKAKGSPEAKFYISEYIPNKSYEFITEMPLSQLKIRRYFSVENGKTFFTHKVSFEGFLGGFFYSLFSKKYKESLPKVMNNIKNITENVEFDSEKQIYLKKTDQINFDSKEVSKLIKKIIKENDSEKDKALKIFDYVKNEIKFGFSDSFYLDKASDVINKKVGYCTTKTTLFIAMLRSVGIPSRFRFVEIKSDVLSNLVNTGSDYLDHGFTEVYLNNKWLKVDSYTIDSELYNSARNKLNKEKSSMGYGIHIDGVNTWDGESDSLVQYIENSEDKYYVKKSFGIYEDQKDFYSKNDGNNKLNILNTFIFKFFSSYINKNIDNIRFKTN